MVFVSKDEIPVEKFETVLKEKSVGAIVVFLGEPRRSNEDGPVISISYTAYKEMAEKEMLKIEKEAKKRFGVKNVIIAHRLGNIPLKTISFFVGISAPHRKECFEACAWVVDQVKLLVPIWKEIKYEGSRDR